MKARLPEPGRLWIRYSPRDWPAPDAFWADLASARLGRCPPPGGAPPDLADVPDLASGSHEPLDDLLYLPPVAPEREAARDALARERLAAGTPVLVQVLAGDPPPAAPGAVVVLDPLAALLAGGLAALCTGGLAALERLPAGAAAVWPLVAGLTDDPSLWDAGCARLAAAGAAVVQPLALDLDPADRRRLVDRCGEAAFDPLFHQPAPSVTTERDFARTARRHGLSPFLPRPLPSPPAAASFWSAGAANRRLGGDLALAAELWLRLERPAGQGQALYAAARQADRTAYDLAGVAREGNLAALSWLDAAGRAMVEEGAAGKTPALLAALLAEYVGPES